MAYLNMFLWCLRSSTSVLACVPFIHHCLISSSELDHSSIKREVSHPFHTNLSLDVHCHPHNVSDAVEVKESSKIGVTEWLFADENG